MSELEDLGRQADALVHDRLTNGGLETLRAALALAETLDVAEGDPV